MWAVQTYTPLGEKLKYGAANPNYTTLGLELCENKNGSWEQTYRNAVALAAYLLQRNKLTINDLYRHSELVTGRNCPALAQ